MRALLLCLTVGVGLVFTSCQGRCTTDAQCGSGRVCVAPAGVCLTACQAPAQCASGQLCNAKGLCVSGCTASSDCGPGQTCGVSGTCVGGGSSTSAAADAGPVTCGGQKFEATATPANILIVLDHSCSMQEIISNNTSKWATATAAVRTLTSQNATNDKLHFGLQVFSLNPNACDPGHIDVAVGGSTASAISSALPSTAEGNATPIGAALHVAATSGQLVDVTRANYALLITDGIENCGGAPVAEVEGLFARGVRTYTVGFGSDVDVNRLTQMAVKGGTARATMPRYFQADNTADLGAALTAITSGAASCDFTLTTTPPNSASLYVAIDGQFFPRDPSRVAGWDYQAAGNRVTLYGPACDIVTQRPGAKVSVIYGCPDDTLTERGPNGGLDAGIVNLGDGGFAWPADGGAIPEIN